MARKDIELEVSGREVGKSATRKLRQNQWAPAILYSNKQETLPLSLEYKYVDKYKSVLSDNPIFKFKSKDKALNGKQAIVQDIVFHPLNRKPLHIDFYAITAGEKITVEVTIELIGEPKGVKDGGNLSVPHHTIEVECLPKDIPDSIQHDVSELDIGDSVHLSDLKIPEGVEVTTTEDITIAICHEVREETVEPVPSEDDMSAAEAAVGEGEGEEGAEGSTEGEAKESGGEEAKKEGEKKE